MPDRGPAGNSPPRSRRAAAAAGRSGYIGSHSPPTVDSITRSLPSRAAGRLHAAWIAPSVDSRSRMPVSVCAAESRIHEPVTPFAAHPQHAMRARRHRIGLAPPHHARREIHAPQSPSRAAHCPAAGCVRSTSHRAAGATSFSATASGSRLTRMPMKGSRFSNGIDNVCRQATRASASRLAARGPS